MIAERLNADAYSPAFAKRSRRKSSTPGNGSSIADNLNIIRKHIAETRGGNTKKAQALWLIERYGGGDIEKLEAVRRSLNTPYAAGLHAALGSRPPKPRKRKSPSPAYAGKERR